MTARDAIPADWVRHLRGGPLGVGYDVATTEKKMSNPSSITVMEDYGGRYWERLVVRFKSCDPDAALQAAEVILTDAPQDKLVALCVDASNEKYYAQSVKKKFRHILPVHLIASGETVVWEREKFSYKTLLGSLYVSSFEDAKQAMPDEEWLIADHRLVKNHAGGFKTELDKEGNHGDTFDSGKLALWSLQRGGRGAVEGIRAMAVGGGGTIAPGNSSGLNRAFALARQQGRARLNG